MDVKGYMRSLGIARETGDLMQASKLLVHFQITMKEYCSSREHRLRMLSELVGRDIKSTYQLTVSEVRAILDTCADHPHEFQHYMNYLRTVTED